MMQMREARANAGNYNQEDNEEDDPAGFLRIHDARAGQLGELEDY